MQHLGPAQGWREGSGSAEPLSCHLSPALSLLLSLAVQNRDLMIPNTLDRHSWIFPLGFYTCPCWCTFPSWKLAYLFLLNPWATNKPYLDPICNFSFLVFLHFHTALSPNLGFFSEIRGTVTQLVWNRAGLLVLEIQTDRVLGEKVEAYEASLSGFTIPFYLFFFTVNI